MFDNVHLLLDTFGLYCVIYLIANFCATMFAVFLVLENAAQADYKRRHPPISDKEFVKRCRPGTNPQIAIRVRHIISEATGMPVEHIHPDTKIIELD